MKRSKEDAAETRRHIVDIAAQELRENGLQYSVADLMSSAGLTHGGFYRHFDSKEELIGEACKEAMLSMIDTLESVARRSSKENALKKLIERYLSPSHRDKCANGCPLAALGSELTRSDRAVRAIAFNETGKLIALIASLLDQDRHRNVESEAQFILTSMLGTLTLARIAIDVNASNTLLRNTAESADRRVLLRLREEP